MVSQSLMTQGLEAVGVCVVHQQAAELTILANSEALDTDGRHQKASTRQAWSFFSFESGKKKKKD